ncbi:MAG: hypothetical protein SCM11_05045 [Bacillota bacterium]|nr:hypothetical protein [Bacillota bacterium]
MRPYIFGIDRQNPLACARELAIRGIGAIVIGGRPDAAIIEAADRYNLDVYACFGAFSLRDDFANVTHWCQDLNQVPQRWFSSGCPNDPDLRQARLDEAAAIARTPGLKGIFVDGARFASPASAESLPAFLTCFCPRCRQKAISDGFDMDQMQQAVQVLNQFIRTGNGTLSTCIANLTSWLAFRRHCMKTYYSDFIQQMRRQNNQLQIGAFIFSDSLATWVGQTADVVSGLDLVAPMLYRRYPEKNGPACLNHEWSILLDALTARSGLTLAQAAETLRPFSQLNLDCLAPQHDSSPRTATEIRRFGFEPEMLTQETAMLVHNLPAGKPVVPIIQLEDDRLADSIAAVKAGGASSYGFFMYRPDLLDRINLA